MKRTTAALLIAMLMLPGLAHAAPKVMITTYVVDFEVTNGNIGCPKGPWGNAFAVNIERLMGKMNARQMEEFMRLVDQFERDRGVKVTSKTTVKDFQVAKDAVKTESTGPATGIGADLCTFVGPFI